VKEGIESSIMQMVVFHERSRRKRSSRLKLGQSTSSLHGEKNKKIATGGNRRRKQLVQQVFLRCGNHGEASPEITFTQIQLRIGFQGLALSTSTETQAPLHVCV